MIWAETAPTANPIAIWSIMSSLAGGLLLFVLVRLAVHLYRSGDVEAYVRRIADLNPRLIRLQLRVENGLSVGKKLSEISLYVRKNGKLAKAASLADTPLIRQGELDFVQGQGEASALLCPPHSKNEAVLEFRLQEAFDSVYLVYTDAKAKKRKAKVHLTHTGEQLLAFHRF